MGNTATREMTGGLIIFKDDEEVADANVLVEVTEFDNAGRVEVGFMHNGRRHWLKLPLPELLLHVAEMKGSKP